MVAKCVLRDGQLFSNVNAAYNGSCERRSPNPLSFGDASTEPGDAGEPDYAFSNGTPSPGRLIPDVTIGKIRIGGLLKDYAGGWGWEPE